MATESPRNRRYSKRDKSKDDLNCSNNTQKQTQTLATSLVTFVFIVYACGLISVGMSLPPLNPKEALSYHYFKGKYQGVLGGNNNSNGSLKRVGLNIAKEGLTMNQDDDDDDSENGRENEADEMDGKKEQEENPDATPADNTEIDDKENIVPKSTWPVSVTKDKSDWFDLPHPGDNNIKITVPPFWSAPIHNNKLMTRPKAMSIGTCATPDSDTGSYQRGDDCPVGERTIFVAIASYRDWQCRYTIESIFNRAKFPHRIRVGVVDQIVEGDDICNEAIDPCNEKPDQALCKYLDQVDNYLMDAPLSVGPVFARHIGHRLYRGEYYSMQSDAHVTFTQNWDVDIIEQMEATGDDMTVLTTYLTDIVGSIDEKTGNSLRHTRPIMCNTDYEGGPQGKHLRHMSQPERYPPKDLTMPQLEPYWAAGFSFSRGHFVVNVPYDLYQPMIFQGEEMSIGIRGFTIGYDFYAPQRSVCFHHYASNDKTHKRDNVPKFWENSNKYQGIGRKSMARLLGIVKMNPEVDSSFWDHKEEAFYGLGGVRTPEKFYSTFGIDVHAKKTHNHLCDFVETGTMHKKFMPHLRSDGMGVDYSRITYKH